MGQAKFNPRHLAAQRGELPPKPKPLSSRARKAMVMAAVAERTGLGRVLHAMGEDKYPY